MDYIEYLNKFERWESANNPETYILSGDDKAIRDAMDHHCMLDYVQQIRDLYNTLTSLAGRTGIDHRVDIIYSCGYVKIYIWILED